MVSKLALTFGGAIEDVEASEEWREYSLTQPTKGPIGEL